jgi:thiamine pyrophosphate-dependent acetolactate synthase large subunit-like protein
MKLVKLTGGQALVRVLKASGITDYYGVCGGNLTSILGEINATEELSYIGCRHEAAGAMMAAGAYMATGRLAVCIAEQGPGSTNLVGGLGVALNNHIPLLAISSSLPTHRGWPNDGTLMEANTAELMAPITKWNTHVMTMERLPEIIRQAIRQALTGAPGPVHLNITSDILKGEGEFSEDELNAPLSLFLPSGRAQANAEAVRSAAEALSQAKRPVLLAGGGVVHSEATEAFRTLAKKLNAPATCSQMAIGVVSTEDPNFIGHGGALADPPTRQALSEADVVVAVGCRFSSWFTDKGKAYTQGWPNQKVIHIDSDPTVPGRAVPADWALIGDAQTVLNQIIDCLADDAKNQRDPEWLPSLVKAHQSRHNELLALAEKPAEVPHPATVALAIDAALPEDSLVVYDAGHTSFWSNTLTRATHPRTRFNDSGIAQLGFGTPFAHALKACAPDKPVFSITGDGSFGFTLQELDTARRYGIPAIHIIHNNSAWGVIRVAQQRSGFEMGTELEETDYAEIARAFGCYGEKVEQLDNIGPAIQRALDSGLPAVLDIRTSFEHHPCFKSFGASLS